MGDWALISWWVGGGVGVAALGVVALALFRDRARGRRRCPSCWYDMSGVVGMKCPECGRTQAREKRFFRTRRRWRLAAVGAVLMIVGVGTASGSAWYTGSWVRYTPTWVLRVAAGFFKADAEGARARFEKSGGAGPVTSWERVLIASSLAGTIREELAGPPPDPPELVAGLDRLGPWDPLVIAIIWASMLGEEARVVAPELGMCLENERGRERAVEVQLLLPDLARANQRVIVRVLGESDGRKQRDQMVLLLDRIGARDADTLAAVRRFSEDLAKRGEELESVAVRLLFGICGEPERQRLAVLVRSGAPAERLLAVSVAGRLAHSRDNTRVRMGSEFDLTELLLRGTGTLRFPTREPLPAAIDLVREATTDTDEEVRVHAGNVLAGIKEEK